MKYLLPFLFAATLAVSGFVSSAAGQSTSSGSEPDNSDGRSADVLAPRTKPNTVAPNPSGKKTPITASLFKDEKGKTPSMVFGPSEKIYLMWKDPTGAKGDKVRIAWFAEDTGKAFPKNKKLSEGTQTLPGPSGFGTSVAPSVQGGLPVGKYRVEVYNNTKLDVSVKFTIQK